MTLKDALETLKDALDTAEKHIERINAIAMPTPEPQPLAEHEQDSGEPGVSE